MTNMIRISVLAHRVIPGNPTKTKDYLFKALSQLNDVSPDIIVLPSLSLCGAGIDGFYNNSGLLESCRSVLGDIIKKTNKTGAYLIAGLPVRVDGKIINASAVLHGGKLLGFLQAGSRNENFCCEDGVADDQFLREGTLFNCGQYKFAVVCCDPMRLGVYASECVNSGADIIINTSAVHVTPGYIDGAREAASSFSKASGTAVVLCNGNIGESCSDGVYRSFAGIFECGEELDFKVHDNSYFISTADIDGDVISRCKYVKSINTAAVFHETHVLHERDEVLRQVKRNPYIPEEEAEASKYFGECLELQVRALAGRLRNGGISKAVVGVSGGVDSALTLIASCLSMDKMHQPRSNVIAVRMDAGDTADADAKNADMLVSALGASVVKVPVEELCEKTLAGVGKNPSNKNQVYERTLQRKRAGALLTLADGEQALTVGTCDLSELAMGFVEKGADAMLHYNVNSTLTKSMVRGVLEYCSEKVFDGEAAQAVKNILDVPVSPYLLPLNEEGKRYGMTPQTERYELYDFFLYYFAIYGMAPQKIYQYALKAFESVCTPDEIKNALVIFYNRFFAGEHVRRSFSESPEIGKISITGKKRILPPDALAPCATAEAGNV